MKKMDRTIIISPTLYSLQIHSFLGVDKKYKIWAHTNIQFKQIKILDLKKKERIDLKIIDEYIKVDNRLLYTRKL